MLDEAGGRRRRMASTKANAYSLVRGDAAQPIRHHEVGLLPLGRSRWLMGNIIKDVRDSINVQ